MPFQKLCTVKLCILPLLQAIKIHSISLIGTNIHKNCYIAVKSARLTKYYPVKKKYEVEYPINSSPKILYNLLSTPGGLAEWFADDVNLHGSEFSFIWDDTEQKADMVQHKDFKYIRFHWIGDEDDDSFFEFRLTQDELTGDVSLLITDFADDDEKNDAVDLWDTQIAQLKHVIGL